MRKLVFVFTEMLLLFSLSFERFIDALRSTDVRSSREVPKTPIFLFTPPLSALFLICQKPLPDIILAVGAHAFLKWFSFPHLFLMQCTFCTLGGGCPLWD